MHRDRMTGTGPLNWEGQADVENHRGRRLRSSFLEAKSFVIRQVISQMS